MQQSWWQELLKRQRYQVVSPVKSVGEVLTFSIGGEAVAGHPLFLTAADLDWPMLLTMVAHEAVLARAA